MKVWRRTRMSLASDRGLLLLEGEFSHRGRRGGRVLDLDPQWFGAIESPVELIMMVALEGERAYLQAGLSRQLALVLDDRQRIADIDGYYEVSVRKLKGPCRVPNLHGDYPYEQV